MTGKQISAQELQARIEQHTLGGSIIDVRTPEEFARGHISGARNMPVEELGAHTAGLNKEENLYVYCLSGGRSQIGVAQLDAAGFANVFNVTSGLLAWRAANLPLVNS